MPKSRISYICSNCHAVSIKWSGQCPSCLEWNTLEEQVEVKGKSTSKSTPSPSSTLLREVKSMHVFRYDIPSDNELERVLGGGIVSGSIVLIGGQPGIGKSTLMLQLACRIDKKVLYVSGEESAFQVKMRADRITKDSGQCHILCETQLERILSTAEAEQPDLLLIDSIQTVRSSLSESLPGSVSQIRECTSALQQYAKSSNVPVFIIGHINKDGGLAGPKVLEHIVDVVLQFEGDRNYMYRILRTLKNRFGSTDEIGIYEMDEQGLRPVTNPSELLLSPTDVALSGTSICSTIEGIRPLLIETQALVSTTVYGHPQRSTTGYDSKRLSMLLAVLEKKCGLYYSQQDVFLNIAGGIKVTDPAIDLSIIASLISSLHDIAVGRQVCFAGEVGLSGEIRAVSRIDQRIQEASRLGFETIYLSKYQNKGLSKSHNIEVKAIGNVRELLHDVFS
ncbi:MAG: DNA repair protein RadA [Bacteroidota bacterium]